MRVYKVNVMQQKNMVHLLIFYYANDSNYYKTKEIYEKYKFKKE